MKFIVSWDEEIAKAIDQVFEAASASERVAIVAALEKISDDLRNEAMDVGESRGSGLVRVLSELPVTVHFRVTDRLTRVRVFSAQIYRRP